MSSAKLNATGLRWVGDLADFDFSIKYRPGKANADADGLSRNPLSIEDLEVQHFEEIGAEEARILLISTNNTISCPIDVKMLQWAKDSKEAISKRELMEVQIQ